MAVSNLEVRLSRWRESFHLIADPFKQYEADQERGFLPYCFVDRPYLHNILGDPKHPQTAFLSAASGEGKTATRQMVVYECQSGFLKGKALPVCYDSFEEFHDGSIGDLSQATLQHHINAISRRLFATLKTDVEPTFFDRLQPFDADLLLGLAETYASSVCKMWLQRVLPGATPLKGAAAGLSPAETLLQLAELVCALGPTKDTHFQALYILVDRVDEIQKGDPQASLQALAPLIRENALINREKLALKFFLPDEFIQAARGMLPVSAEKVVFETIQWDAAQLYEVINQRLSYFSGGKIVNFEQLFAGEILTTRTREKLIDRTNGSPRALIRLFNHMVQIHAERSARTALLDRDDLNEAVVRLDHETDIIRQPKTAQASSSTPPARGLYLDENGHIWIDGKMPDGSLSQQEITLIRKLYNLRPAIVPFEELIRCVWPESKYGENDQKARVFDEQNLRKLVDRLRGKLVTQDSEDKNRFIHNMRGQGYWLSLD